MAEVYDNKYFDNMVREGNGLTPNAEETIKEQKEVLEHADKKTLKELANATPREFYTKLCAAYGSAMMNKSRSLDITKRAGAMMVDLSVNVKTKPAFVQWLFKATTFIAKTILGVVKFSWDLVLTAGAFIGRMSYHLGYNIGVALVNTACETKEDAIGAGIAISKSFKDNIIPEPKIEVEVV